MINARPTSCHHHWTTRQPTNKNHLLPIQNEHDSDQARDVRVGQHTIARVKMVQLAVTALTWDSEGHEQDS